MIWINHLPFEKNGGKKFKELNGEPDAYLKLWRKMDVKVRIELGSSRLYSEHFNAEFNFQFVTILKVCPPPPVWLMGTLWKTNSIYAEHY